MSENGHVYPSEYGKGKHWATDKAWEILDNFKPGAIKDENRFLLAGMIAGALMEERHKSTIQFVDMLGRAAADITTKQAAGVLPTLDKATDEKLPGSPAVEAILEFERNFRKSQIQG